VGALAVRNTAAPATHTFTRGCRDVLEAVGKLEWAPWTHIEEAAGRKIDRVRYTLAALGLVEVQYCKVRLTEAGKLALALILGKEQYQRSWGVHQPNVVVTFDQDLLRISAAASLRHRAKYSLRRRRRRQKDSGQAAHP
jgi:hypothetical protein